MTTQIGVGYPNTRPQPGIPGVAIPPVNPYQPAGPPKPIITKKPARRLDITCDVIRTDAQFVVSGTWFMVMIDRLKWTAGIPDGCYLRLDSLNNDAIPIPAFNVDSSGAIVTYPPLDLGGIYFENFYLTTPASGTTFGFSIVTFVEQLDDYVRP